MAMLLCALLDSERLVMEGAWGRRTTRRAIAEPENLDRLIVVAALLTILTVLTTSSTWAAGSLFVPGQEGPSIVGHTCYVRTGPGRPSTIFPIAGRTEAHHIPDAVEGGIHEYT